MRGKIFTFFIIFLIILVGISYWIYQRQSFSKEILKLEILGPETCQAGQEIEYTVKYKNNGNVRLEELRLTFEYPEGSLLSEGEEERIIKDLEDVYPGQEEILKFKARVFGKEGEIKTAKANLSYRPKNLKAFYESKSTCSTKIEGLPITFGFDFPSKIVAGKEIKVSLNYFSNLDFPLSDLRVKVEYPQNFEFLRSKPEGIEKNEWEIAMLNKAEGGRIDIFGTISGEVGGQKIFKAQLGIWVRDNFFLLKEIARGVEIVRPRLSISQRINGLSDYIASPGELLHYEIFFRNIGEEAFEDLFLVARLEGPFELESINSETGKVNLADRSILWEWRDVPELQYLAPGEEGRVEFWINLKRDWGIEEPSYKNFILRNKISLSRAREEFETKINSRLEISQKGYFEDEVFGNSGPIPPRVGEKTTYTIVWQVKNYYNDVNNVKVRAILPPGVKLTGKIFPEEEKEKFTFDSQSGEILWDVGLMPAGTGILSPQKSLAFQIELCPSENQKELVVTLINEAKISGEDMWTGINLRQASPAVDTTLPDDPTVNPEQGVVQE